MIASRPIGRRQILKTAVAGTAWAALWKLLPGLSLAADDRSRRPNIVLIMADDMGFSDIGCYGGEIQTPNLDGLAECGVRFTRMYNTARCCPTRASILTGLYPHQTGVGHMLEDTDLPGYQTCLNDQCVTIAEVLRLAGYATLMSGKWHVGAERPHWPCDRGFEESFLLTGGWANYFKPKDLALNDAPYTPPDGEKYYLTDDFTDHAVKLVEKHGKGEKPFFLYMAYTAPHWPLHAPADQIKKYKDIYLAGWEKLRKQRHERMIKMGIVEEKWRLSDRDAPPWDSIENKEKWPCEWPLTPRRSTAWTRASAKCWARSRNWGPMTTLWCCSCPITAGRPR